MGGKEDWQERMNAVWDQLKEVVSNDNGLRATLKRNAGLRLCEADWRAKMAFYRICGVGLVSLEKEDRFFLAVCVSCLWKPDEWSRGKPLVEGARNFLDQDSRDTFVKRLRVLMDLPWDEDGYIAGKLCRLLKFCKSKGIVVDGKELLQDLLGWNADNRWVQRKWAREFYRIERKDNKGGKENAD